MMSLFTPPTDNLYKFMALAGIILIVAGVVVPPVYFQQTATEYLVQLRGGEELRVYEEFTKERLETLKLREQQAIDEKNKLQKRLDGLNSASNSTEVDKLEARIKEANREIESIVDSSYELSLNLALKRAQSNYEETRSFNSRRDARFFVMIGWGAAVIGAFFSVIGFRMWYTRLQQFQDGMVSKDAEAKLAAKTPNEENKLAQPNQPVQSNQPTPANVPQPTK